jgi:hypothetical protein
MVIEEEHSPSERPRTRSFGAPASRRPLVGRREVGVAVHDPPFAVGADEDVRDADRHGPRLAAVDRDGAALEADGAGEVAALVDHLVLGHERAAGEAAATHSKVDVTASWPFSIGPHAPNSVASAESAQRSA